MSVCRPNLQMQTDINRGRCRWNSLMLRRGELNIVLWSKMKSASCRFETGGLSWNKKKFSCRNAIQQRGGVSRWCVEGVSVLFIPILTVLFSNSFVLFILKQDIFSFLFLFLFSYSYCSLFLFFKLPVRHIVPCFQTPMRLSFFFFVSCRYRCLSAMR